MLQSWRATLSDQLQLEPADLAQWPNQLSFTQLFEPCFVISREDGIKTASIEEPFFWKRQASQQWMVSIMNKWINLSNS